MDLESKRWVAVLHIDKVRVRDGDNFAEQQ